MAEARTYTKVARAAAEAATRTALLDAGEAVFFEGDWDATPLSAIAARAGVTKQTLLRHFGSKDGLRDAGFARGYERVRAERFLAPAGDIEAAVDNLLDHYAAHGARALALGPLPGFGAAARQMHYDWVDHVFGAQPPRTRAALIAICDVHTWAILAKDLELPRAEVRATLVQTVRRVLEGDT